MLPIAETIRTKRREKNVTQEELARILGVSFQAVSRWENGQAYPDIELIPKIAAFFEITTDKLLGADRETREAAIQQLYTDCRNAAQEEDPLKRHKIRMDAFRKLPENHKWTYHLASDIVHDLVHSDILHREEALPLVRELCTLMLTQSVDPLVHNWALRSIYIYEDEDRLPEWSRYVSAFMTEPELMALRFSCLGEYDRYHYQLQENLYQTIWHTFPLRIHKCYADEEKTARAAAAAAETTLKLYDLFRDPSDDMDLFLEQRGWTFLYLAKSRFRLGDRENGYRALEKAVALCEKLFTLPDGTELKTDHPSFDLLTVSNTSYIPKKPGYSLRSQYKNFYDALTVSEDQWEWFRPYMNEERFLALTCRVKKLRHRKESSDVGSDYPDSAHGC